MAFQIPHPVLKAISTIWHVPGRTLRAMNHAASIAMWAQVGAGVAATALLYWYGHAILTGPWPASAASKVLSLLGQGQAWSAIIMLVALTAIAGLRLGMKASKSGFDLSAEKDDGPETPTVIATVTETTITPGTKPEVVVKQPETGE